MSDTQIAVLPAPAPSSRISSLFVVPVVGGSGKVVCDSAPRWAKVGMWAFFEAGGISATYRITSVEGREIHFDSWTPSSQER